jgi:integrase
MKLIHKRKLDTNQIGIVAYNRLQSTLNVIDKSEVAHKDINTVTSEELQDYFNTLTYYSNSYISKIIEQFSQAFKYAMNKGFLLANPMYDTIVPKSTRQDKIIRALDIDEQQKLTTYLINSFTDFEPYKNAFLIELYMGLRIGEVLSLKKEHIDLRRNLITVNTTMTRDEYGKRVIGNTPKTKAGIRQVPIPPNIRNEIIEQLQLANTHKENLLFVSNAGTYADPVNVNHVLKRICKSLDIQDVTSHSLRHTFATRCIEAGMRAVALKELMGHSDVSITLNVYASVFNKYKNSELEKVNNYYMNNEIFKNEPKVLEIEHNSDFTPMNFGQELDCGDER